MHPLPTSPPPRRVTIHSHHITSIGFPNARGGGPLDDDEDAEEEDACGTTLPLRLSARDEEDAKEEDACGTTLPLRLSARRFSRASKAVAWDLRISSSVLIVENHPVENHPVDPSSSRCFLLLLEFIVISLHQVLFVRDRTTKCRATGGRPAATSRYSVSFGEKAISSSWYPTPSHNSTKEVPSNE
jgi:hypothetical protein